MDDQSNTNVQPNSDSRMHASIVQINLSNSMMMNGVAAAANESRGSRRSVVFQKTKNNG